MKISRRNFMALMASAAAVGALGLTGCSSSGSSAAASGAASAAGNGKVTLWATGSDNVRQIYESLIADFNSSHDTQVELQYLMSGTGTQSLSDMLVAAAKAGQSNTDYDLVDFSGDDLSKIVSQLGTDYLTKLDKSKIPNAAGVSAQSSTATDFVQPFRGTTVILAYNSETVRCVCDDHDHP